MNIGNYLLVTILIILQSSCMENKSREDLLAGDNYKYWLYSNSDKRSMTKFIYYFDRTGKWIVFSRSVNGEIFKYKASDLLLIPSWSFINDSIVEIGGAHYSIIDLNDSIFKYVDKNQTVQSLLHVPDSLMPINFRKKYSDE